VLKAKILRVQDSDGRGPWRPGFSRLWVTIERLTMRRPNARNNAPDTARTNGPEA